MEFLILSGTGNVFAIADGFDAPALEDPGGTTRALIGAWRGVGGTDALRTDVREEPDGLIVVEPGPRGVDARMRIFNADGSSAAACGNGLRCVAHWLREVRGHANGAARILTDSGLSSVRYRGAQIEVTLGRPRILERDRELPIAGGGLRGTHVDLGNPHCVVFVPDVDSTPVCALGPAIASCGLFPGGVNVEFVTVTTEGLAVRVWERGVGETASCGTGACAAAATATAEGRVDAPVQVDFRGGRLTVDWDGDGICSLRGPCEALGPVEWRRAAQLAR